MKIETRVYRVELCIVDHDGIGEDGIVSLIESARYPNHAIAPRVTEIESRGVEWSDDHPLNKFATSGAAFRELFSKE